MAEKNRNLLIKIISIINYWLKIISYVVDESLISIITLNFFIRILFIKISMLKRLKRKNYLDHTQAHMQVHHPQRFFFLSNYHRIFFTIFKFPCWISGSVRRVHGWRWYCWYDRGHCTLAYEFAVCYIVFEELHHRKYCENCFFLSLSTLLVDFDP